MSCTNCNAAIERGEHTYVRVGVANVLIAGCRYHLGELLRLLEQGREQEGTDGTPR